MCSYGGDLVMKRAAHALATSSSILPYHDVFEVLVTFFVSFSLAFRPFVFLP